MNSASDAVEVTESDLLCIGRGRGGTAGGDTGGGDSGQDEISRGDGFGLEEIANFMGGVEAGGRGVNTESSEAHSKAES